MAVRVTERQQDVLDVLQREGGRAGQEILAMHLGTTFSAPRRMRNALEDLDLVRLCEGHSRMPCGGGGRYLVAELIEPAGEGASE